MDVNLLLSGEKVTCANCQTAIQLDRPSQSVTETAMDQFKRLNDQMTMDEGNTG